MVLSGKEKFLIVMGALILIAVILNLAGFLNQPLPTVTASTIPGVSDNSPPAYPIKYNVGDIVTAKGASLAGTESGGIILKIWPDQNAYTIQTVDHEKNNWYYDPAYPEKYNVYASKIDAEMEYIDHRDPSSLTWENN